MVAVMVVGVVVAVMVITQVKMTQLIPRRSRQLFLCVFSTPIQPR
jgi:hypothetical protein